MPFTAIFQPPLLGSRMSGETGYRAWYSAHASGMVRLPRLKPFAATFLREDDIASAEGGGTARGRGRSEIGSGEIGMGKEGGALLLYNDDRQSGGGALAAINAGANGHAAMHDETRHCAARSVSYGAGAGSERQIPYCFAADGNCF
jgi:hypothetical protein